MGPFSPPNQNAKVASGVTDLYSLDELFNALKIPLDKDKSFSAHSKAYRIRFTTQPIEDPKPYGKKPTFNFANLELQLGDTSDLILDDLEDENEELPESMFNPPPSAPPQAAQRAESPAKDLYLPASQPQPAMQSH